MTPRSTQYSIGSEMITLSPDAESEFAGQTVERWFVRDESDGGRKILSGFASKEAVDQALIERVRDEQKVRVRLAGGGTTGVARGRVKDFRGLDAFGNHVYSDRGYLWPATRCCKASGKGSTDSDTGVVCRRCYREVSAYYGGSARVSIARA